MLNFLRTATTFQTYLEIAGSVYLSSKVKNYNVES